MNERIPVDGSIQLSNEELQKLLGGRAVRVEVDTTLGLQLGLASISAPLSIRLKIAPSGLIPKGGKAHNVSLADSVEISETASGG